MNSMTFRTSRRISKFHTYIFSSFFYLVRGKCKLRKLSQKFYFRILLPPAIISFNREQQKCKLENKQLTLLVDIRVKCLCSKQEAT